MLEAGRRDEVEMGTGDGGGAQGTIAREREDPHEEPSRELEGLWKECVGGKMTKVGERVI